ncbi:biphenyl-2,3-diol 1,2-dioxygenase [Pseudonocardia ailaonensis]|uniref:Biphenyl-2,3-diol 1,2-dioxygenase n=1 Tax=Pseudonocardia ailaonensis TaxID=367279 RepID=A0ABN2N4Y9_9PSEU
MGHVSALGYVGLMARDLDAWQTFGTEVLGLQAMRAADSEGVDTLFLRMDRRHHRIAVREGEDGLGYSGWEVPTEAALDAQIQRLATEGVAYTEDPALAVVRNVRRLVRCTDPAGFPVEIFYGSPSIRAPFTSPTGATFVTSDPSGRDLGLGHLAVLVPDPDKVIDFYSRVLGFRLSDYITFPTVPPMVLTFTHVNGRHHSLAFGPAPEGTSAALDHLLLEVTELDAVGRALDLVRARELSLTATLGRHTNDEMVSFYVKSPSGVGVEYGTNGKLIDDETWTVTNWNAAQFWGHDRNHAH